MGNVPRTICKPSSPPPLNSLQIVKIPIVGSQPFFCGSWQSKTKKKKKNTITQNSTIYLSFSGWALTGLVVCIHLRAYAYATHYSLLLLCKYVVSRLQHNIDSLHVDNTVNDIDLLYCVACYALSPWVSSRGKVFAWFPFTSTRVYNRREALAVGQPPLRSWLNLSHMPHLNQ